MAAQETLLNGRYRLISQQGSGGMAVIYKAQDLQLGRTVAVKILRPSLTGDPSFLTRFRQEARNVANLAHPNIVTLHDVGQDGNTYYMVMEYVEGKDLKKLIRESAPFSVDRALHIGIQICAGIGYAHRAGLVHADVKPQNVLVTPDDTVKVTDFGIAQALSVTQPEEKQSVVWGSPHYFAPEQASGETPTPASDVYAIGIVLFEMLTGKLPYNGNDQQELALAHIRDEVPHVMQLNPNVPVHLDRIIYKVMSKEPANRYRTADQLGRILITYQKQGEDVTSNGAPVKPPPAPSATPITQVNIANVAPRPGAYPTIPSSQGAVPSVQQRTNTPPPQTAYVAPPPQTPYMPPKSNNVPSTPPHGTPRPFPAVSLSQIPPSNAAYQPRTPVYAPQDSYESDPNSRPYTPEYQITPPPPAIDLVTIVLAIVAFLAVLGLFPLWLSVLSTWSANLAR
ncbi:MAG: protein kinase [Chloroflexota bacterium]